MTTRASESLEAKIEGLVREHLAEQQKAARAALERAFGVAMSRRGTTRRRGSYRQRAEVAALAEQLLQAVKACPGETMTVLAGHVGVKGRALQQPMTRLKESGRVRSAGERSSTRYFPMQAARSA